MTRCTIVVVNHNTKKFIELCVRSVLKNAVCSRLVVVDNGSTDGSLKFLRKVIDIELVERKVPMHCDEHGKAIDYYLRTRGLKTEYLMLLDSDAYPAVMNFDAALISLSAGADLFGPRRWNDQNAPHPMAMLVKKSAWEKLSTVGFVPWYGRPRALDTAEAFVKGAREKRLRISVISNAQMGKIVRHRSGVTRHLAFAKDAKKDLLAEERKHDSWFRDPVAQGILKYPIRMRA